MKLHRTVLALLLSAAVTTGLRAQSELPPLPPLNEPATDEVLAGKFVWADLFSNDLTASQAFYQELFGWQFRWISDYPNPYGVFSFRGYDLAGLAYRNVDGEGAYARWIHYLSVVDVAAAQGVVEELGGRTLLRNTVADRGDFAIFASGSEVLLGVMRSSSGDPPDTRSVPGEWIWRQLYTWNLAGSTAALQRIAGYEVRQIDENGRVDQIVLSDGYARAGLKALATDSDASPTWLGFVMAQDVAALVERVPGLGGETYYLDPAGDMAIVADPGGALIGLVEYQYPPLEQASAEGAVP